MTTYGDVKLLAEAKLGMNGCTFTEFELLYAFKHCLYTLANEINQEFYNSTATITLVQDQTTYDIPEGFTVKQVKSPSGICLSSCEPDPCATPIATVPRVSIVPILPNSYVIMNGQIVFNKPPHIPVGSPPLTMTLQGLRPPSPIFYEDVASVRTWLPIDLPEQYTPAFTQCVLGTLMMDIDPGQASNYYSLANDSIKSAQDASKKGVPRAMYKKLGHTNCGCNDCCLSFPNVLQFSE